MKKIIEIAKLKSWQRSEYDRESNLNSKRISISGQK